MDERDIERAARQLIGEYGADACQYAFNAAAALLEQQNYDGYNIWCALSSAIRSMDCPAK
jgi:hypothetical protein